MPDAPLERADMPLNGGGSTPPSSWRTPFAVRTYIAGVFWTAGAILS